MRHPRRPEMRTAHPSVIDPRAFWVHSGAEWNSSAWNVTPMERNQRSGSLIDRVRRQTERRALEQAKRVPWKRLAGAAVRRQLFLRIDDNYFSRSTTIT